jgi:hypothetical protein
MAVCIAIGTIVVSSFSNGIDAKNYSLGKTSLVPFLETDLSDVDITALSAISGSYNSTPTLLPIVATGKYFGAIGTVCWVTGNILEIVGIIKLTNGNNGENLLTSGIILDLFSPIVSCIGESIVINTLRSPEVSFVENSFELKPKGWGYYGKSFLFLGIGALTGLAASSSQNPVLITIASIAGGVSNVLRGAAAIAPLVRTGKVSMMISLQTRPIINQKGVMGLALSCNF